MKQAMRAKPFIKWVGGKGQLLQQLEQAFPDRIYEEEFVYLEPFVGGGAMLFYMMQQFTNIRKVVINDINSNLMCTYSVIKNNVYALVSSLKMLEREYLSIASEEGRKDFYLSMRTRFNEEALDNVERASLLIFLNRTCFNGLYRENLKGKFNVPFGKYENPTICNEDLLYTDSELLNEKDVVIMNGDFTATLSEVEESSLNFFYFDPPYRPLSATSSFNSYVKEEFNDERQRELSMFCRELSTRDNCLWMLSNSDCSSLNPNDTFFENIFKGFNFQRVYAARSVNAVASKRGKLSELLIRNYRGERVYV
ncbi:MAG: Dam family site-specific DNA-(adenine-N6)-methyltransferase [Bacteroidales bacterium]|nr:Dam family site-specific DNA-(adenine-N6)-methyltransferase [Bacteroidales bacterium]